MTKYHVGLSGSWKLRHSTLSRGCIPYIRIRRPGQCQTNFHRPKLLVNRRDKSGAAGLTKGRYALFLGITLAFPLLLLVGIEIALRLADPDDGLALFTRAPAVKGDYLVANRSVGKRWFSGVDNPPTPAHELFAREKPNRAFRVFVMGESAAAGFPYPRNGEFSRLL